MIAEPKRTGWDMKTYRPILFINIAAKILNKILVN